MNGWSLPVGRVFGVEVRLHAVFPLLLVMAMVWAGTLGGNPLRGAMLWALLLLAVLVREAARALAAAWFGLELRSILLLPTGGIVSYGATESIKRAGEPKVQRAMALVGPVTSVLAGLTLAGLVLTVSPGVDLWSQRWVTPEHLVRALVWVNLLLAAVNLLPAWPLDAGRVVQGEVMRARAAGGAEGAAGGRALGMRTLWRIGPGVALGLISYGIVSINFWAIALGIGVFLGAQVERQALLVEADAETVRVRDVMLTEYSMLSASATLEDAVVQARHTLQDVFPVVRAGNLVGAVGRVEILEALEASGNGYVQGIMARTFRTASAGDALGETLGRVTGTEGVSSQLVPVVEGERVVGILTPQNLHRSMGLLLRKQARRASAEPGSRAGREDGRE